MTAVIAFYRKEHFSKFLKQFLDQAMNAPREVASQIPSAQEHPYGPLVRLAFLHPSAQLRSSGLEAQRAEVLVSAFALQELAAEQKANLMLFPKRFAMRGMRFNRRQVWEWAQEE